LFWVKIINDDAKPIDDGLPITNSKEFNSFLNLNNATFWGQAFLGAKDDTLKRIYELRCRDCDIDSIIYKMGSLFPSYFSVFRKQEILENISVYDPTDYFWYLTTQDTTNWLWYLKKIQANLAWNITKGSPSIKIAILDTEFDITHPDLQNKFVLPYDPYSNSAFDCTPTFWHGTTVAGFVAAETIEQGSQGNNGQLASVGFKTMLVGYNAWGGNYLQKAFHASTVMHANIITSSAGGWSNCPDATGWDQLVVKEILDNGTCIIMPAGNGVNGTHNFCQQVDPVNDCPFFPLSPYYDSRIIIVTGTDKNDKHNYFDANSNIDYTQSHYPMVDVCAPGHDLLGAGLTDCGNNNWPYYGSYGGTSFATPIVAGTAALILSVNPCLEPADIELILKSTTDPVVDEANYSGMLGSGRINAYNAVTLAQTYGTVPTINQNETWSDDKFINQIVSIESGATLTITGKIRFAENSKIIIKPGGVLIVNGGLLTNSKGCSNPLWEGIEVWGTSNQHQYTYSGNCYQGKLILMNGATIENAREAVVNRKYDDWNSMGGIIQADNANFINNHRAILFMPYSNFNPNNPSETRDDLSFINNCNFETNNNLIDGQFHSFITM